MIKIIEIVNNSLNYPVENKYFTQFNTSTNYTLCPNFLNSHKVDSNTSKIKILSSKFIDTPKGESIEGQKLTGKKLSIIGIIYVNIIFHNIFSNKNHVVTVPINYSCFIIVPEEICTEDNINLGYLIEDISIARVSKNKILTSSTLILSYQNYH